jgi:hypothetical protein
MSPVFVDATGCRKRVMQCLVGILAVGGLTYTGLVGMSVGSAQDSPLDILQANPLPHALADPDSSAAQVTPSPPNVGRQGMTANVPPAGGRIGRPGEPAQERQALPVNVPSPTAKREPVPESTPKPKAKPKPNPKREPVPESTPKPKAKPKPSPKREPVPESTPKPKHEPAPESTTQPVPNPTGATPTTEPAPAPIPKPAPEPIPAPDPARTTESACDDAKDLDAAQRSGVDARSAGPDAGE